MKPVETTGVIAIVGNWRSPAALTALGLAGLIFGLSNIHDHSIDLRKAAVLGLIASFVLVGAVPELIARLINRKPRLFIGADALVIPGSEDGDINIEWSQIETVRIVSGRLPYLELAVSDTTSQRLEEAIKRKKRRFGRSLFLGRLWTSRNSRIIKIVVGDLDVSRKWLLQEVQNRAASHQINPSSNKQLSTQQLESIRLLAEGERIIGNQWQVDSREKP